MLLENETKEGKNVTMKIQTFLTHKITTLDDSIVNYRKNQKYLFSKFLHTLGNVKFFRKCSNKMFCPIMHKKYMRNFYC